LWGSEFGAIPVGQILLHGAAAHGGLDIFSALRNDTLLPSAACPRPGNEKFGIRLNDSVRVHPSGARRPEAIHDPSRRSKDWRNRQAVAICRKTEDDNHPVLGAGTQGEHGPARIRSTPAGSGASARAPTRSSHSAEVHHCSDTDVCHLRGENIAGPYGVAHSSMSGSQPFPLRRAAWLDAGSSLRAAVDKPGGLRGVEALSG